MKVIDTSGLTRPQSSDEDLSGEWVMPSGVTTPQWNLLDPLDSVASQSRAPSQPVARGGEMMEELHHVFS